MSLPRSAPRNGPLETRSYQPASHRPFGGWRRVRHSNESALRERQIKQRSHSGKHQSHANLVDQHEGGKSPQLVERQQEKEQLAELVSEFGVTERESRQQIQANRNSYGRTHQHDGG